MPNRQPPNSINIGSQANSGTGDNLRDAFIKVNGNFTDIYNLAVFQPDLISAVNQTLENISVNVTPNADISYNLGTTSKRWKELHSDSLKTSNIVNENGTLLLTAGSSRAVSFSNPIEFIGPTDNYQGPAIGIRNISSGSISFFDNHSHTYGVYNYTMNMSDGNFSWSFSNVNSPYDLGQDKMVLDHTGNLTVNNSLYVLMDITADRNISASNNISASKDIDAGRNILASNNISASNDIDAGRNILASNNISATIDVTAGRNISASNNISATVDIISGRNISASGNIYAGGDVTAYSDARLKTNVQTIENALDKTRQLRGVTFDKDGKNSLGVIAQEVQKILPQVVVEGNDENKTLSVAYGNIVGLLIEAVKELTDKVERLEKLIGK